MASLSTADRIELADLVARYAARVDEGRADVPELFCDDAVLVMPEPPDRLDPVTNHHGRAAIGEMLAALADFPVTRHALLGSVFDATDDVDVATGTVRCDAHHVSERRPGEFRDIVWHLHYEDTYRRVDGTWRFTRREARIDWLDTAEPRRVLPSKSPRSDEGVRRRSAGQ